MRPRPSFQFLAELLVLTLREALRGSSFLVWTPAFPEQHPPPLELARFQEPCEDLPPATDWGKRCSFQLTPVLTLSCIIKQVCASQLSLWHCLWALKPVRVAA